VRTLRFRRCVLHLIAALRTSRRSSGAGRPDGNVYELATESAP
jgi:hypothetical protein